MFRSLKVIQVYNLQKKLTLYYGYFLIIVL